MNIVIADITEDATNQEDVCRDGIRIDGREGGIAEGDLNVRQSCTLCQIPSLLH
jgi:hypothetical protein